MNKLLAIGLIIFFILVIAGGAVWLTRPESAAEEPERGFLQRFPFGLLGDREEIPETVPPTDQARTQQDLTSLTAEKVESFAVVSGGVRFIESQTGHVSETGPQGEEQTRLSNTTITKIFDVNWSNTASKAILKYREEDNTRIISAEFTATSTKAVVLPQNIISSVFSGNRERIAYLVPTPNGSRLIAADPDNSGQTEVASLSFKDFDLFWPDINSIYLSSRPSGEVGGFLFGYDLARESLDKVLGDIAGLQVKFSADEKKIVYSSYDQSQKKPFLFIYDLDKNTTTDIQANGLAEKCAFSKTDRSIIYCGLDQNIVQALYPDDWLNGAVSTFDLLWEINIDTGQRRQLLNSEVFNIKQIDTSDDGQFIYFIDKNNGSLWSLKVN